MELECLDGRVDRLLKQLVHNGIVIPEPPEPVGLVITVRGKPVALTPEQEEMALAWARKKDTPYVQDEVFAANFFADFSAALGIDPPLTPSTRRGSGLPLTPDEIDLTPAYAVVDAERAAKEAMTREERKAAAAARKEVREALKARYGYAIVNGQRVELGNYMTEPSGIFMGRGEHPLRGRWKEGARREDVTLNLSPDAPPVEGNWQEIVWQPESLWVARWKDKLADKLKYIWLSDTAPVKQQREALKFDKAVDLDAEIDRVRARIQLDLSHENARRRMIATACYLIDTLCLRVGDEKDPDEADTVGATTLRPEHVTIRDDGVVEFCFLGKDSVEWNKSLQPPQMVLDNLAELVRNARPSSPNGNGDRNHPTRDKPQLFPNVSSRDVNAYLSGIQPGLTAKVFRTHHATAAVEKSLAASGVKPRHPEYVKWQAANMANLEAAVLCNHTKKETGNWPATRQRYQERRVKAEERVARYQVQVKEFNDAYAALKEEARAKEGEAATDERRKRVRQRYQKRLATARRRTQTARERVSKAQIALGKIKAQATIASKKRTWNLGTSLKSYIDPRVYYRWGQEVDYDVLERYYPTILRRKFAWVRSEAEEEARESEQIKHLTARTCMADDLHAVAELFRSLNAQYPEAELPVEVDAIDARYLPHLGEPWREAMVVLGEESEVVAFAALGPAWTNGSDEPVLDIFAAVRPESATPALHRLLVRELARRQDAYRLNNPKEQAAMVPSEPGWLSYAPELAEALGLVETEDEEDVAEDEE